MKAIGAVVAFGVLWAMSGVALHNLSEKDPPSSRRLRTPPTELCQLVECSAKAAGGVQTVVITGQVNLGRAPKGGRISYNESDTREVRLCAEHLAMAHEGRWPLPPADAKMLPWYAFCVSGVFFGFGYGVYRKIAG